VLDAVRDTSKVAWILLGKAGIDTVEGNVITMAFDSEGNAKGFASSGSDGYLANVLERMFGTRPVIRAIVNAASAASPASGAARWPEGNAGGSSGRPAPRPVPGAAASADQDKADGAASQSAAAGTRGTPATGGGAGAATRAGSRGGQEQGRRPNAGSRTSAPDQNAEGQDGNDQADAGQAAGEPAAVRSPRPARRGGRATSAPTRQNQSSGSELSDDPRPHTDGASGGGDDLIGTDLIMRELGGTMIEDT
jgi:DNA polymerase-3 subunit gamma/tau